MRISPYPSAGVNQACQMPIAPMATARTAPMMEPYCVVVTPILYQSLYIMQNLTNYVIHRCLGGDCRGRDGGDGGGFNI